MSKKSSWNGHVVLRHEGHAHTEHHDIELKLAWCETFEQELLLLADLTTSEFVSRYTGYKLNNVWSGLKSTHTEIRDDTH